MTQALATPSRRPLATYADVEALPDHVVGEILAGELVVSPRPAMRHASATSTLGALLNVAFHIGLGGPGGWWILDEPELSLGVDPRYEAVVPDIAGWRRETTPGIPDVVRVKLVPDWVCEVLSPDVPMGGRPPLMMETPMGTSVVSVAPAPAYAVASGPSSGGPPAPASALRSHDLPFSPCTSRHDRVLKVPFYARAGVRHCWLVDPIAQTLEVLRLEGGRWVIVASVGGDETVRVEPFEAIELPLRALWDRGETTASDP